MIPACAQDRLDVTQEDRRERTGGLAVDPEDRDIGVAIDDEARRAIALAVEEPVGGRRAVGEELAAERDGAVEPLGEDRRVERALAGDVPHTRTAIGDSGS